jgi:predicted MPP superfamily phosphohydrolase
LEVKKLVMKMKITHISDTHNKHKQLDGKLPGGDILIHSGDISSLGRKREVESFIKWFNDIEGYGTKIFIAGNHDMTFDREILLRDKLKHFDGRDINDYDTECAEGKPEWLIELLENGLNNNVFYLENSFVLIDDIKIWGSPITPSFGYGWAFNKNRGYDINEVWNGIPDDANIVVTHGPIHSYCDRTQHGGMNVGCEQLYHRLNEVRPQLHFSGHIHEAYGYRHTDWGYAFNGCNCDLGYMVNNTPLAFEYDFLKRDIVEFN